MGKKQKKRRQKKYQKPQDVGAEPVIHKYVAEIEEKETTHKKRRLKLIILAVLASLLLFIAELIF